jgi:hypothetical protein
MSYSAPTGSCRWPAGTTGPAPYLLGPAR